MSDREVRQLAAGDGPAAAWQVTTLMTADGELAAKTIGADYYTVKGTISPSRIRAASTPTFLASVVVIDIKSAAGLTLTQLADYAAMRTFADVAPERVAKVGVPSILGVLGQRDGRAAEDVAPIFGRDSALGPDANAALGGLIGNQIGEAFGAGGLGQIGSGTGGGGTGEGTLGMGGIGTIGKGYGRGAGSLGGRRAFAPEVAQGEANVRGALDKEIVRRIVRRHMNEIKYCYEQQLARFPGLAGRVVVQFTIGGNGDVIASVLQSSTVANGALETCIVQAVHRWLFPSPHGGLVIISYPFVLTPGDGVTPYQPIADALAILGGRASIVERVERVAARLGHRPISDPEVLAWTIQRRGQGVQVGLLVGRLLHLAGRDHDAVRVLSESAGEAAQPIAAELRAIGAPADAAEVLRLAKR